MSEAAKKAFLDINYDEAIQLYEQNIIEGNSTPVENYAYLGLAYLLTEDEEAAQFTWLTALSTEGETTDATISSLTEILGTESKRQSELGNLRNSWLICRYIQELNPVDIENLVNLINRTMDLGEFHPNLLEEWDVLAILQQHRENIETIPIERLLQRILTYPFIESIDFSEACIEYVSSQTTWLNILLTAAKEISLKQKLANFSTLITELCLKYVPQHPQALCDLIQYHLQAKRYREAVEIAYQYYQQSQTLETQFFSNCLLLQSLLQAGNWQDIPVVSARHEAFLEQLFQAQPTNLSTGTTQFLISKVSPLLYLRDDIAINRHCQNQAAQLFLRNVQNSTPSKPKSVQINPIINRRLRIGYIASTLRRHSVGWLSRWLFQYHNRDEFEIFAYLVQQRPEDEFYKTWFAPHLDHQRFIYDNPEESAELIHRDNLDILIDLDSITHSFTCNILALKPAPVQVSWLGCDASGLPTIDYFIADPYVLPPDAQQHYQEKIWQMPHTYIAVDGFEVNTPTLRRQNLEIPEDAVIYFSSQAGMKRFPQTLRSQLQILQAVPNSYFLIKGLADQSILESMVYALAREVGVSPKRLRFLARSPDEYTHRANLQLADIVLDTYPYNGATTTLETLWMGIPLVTRVGEQFAARNSYAFMMNVGVREGIAWTDQEYIEWGIRLGQDESLRQTVAWKLKASRHHSPLWNARAFTKEMENSFRQMISA
jgi:predicted O-linked N-acetylglucosamine transferase (SPINDLY family)